MRRVTIAIPTFRRPEGLLRAVRSAFAQSGDFELEIVVVDNAPEHSAEKVIEMLAKESPCAFRWIHERRAGVAQARNAALELARGDVIAWLDDDQEAPPGWVGALLVVQDKLGADVVFGPVRAAAPEGPHRAYFESLYSRAGPKISGITQTRYGIGNALVRRAVLWRAPFDARANETGGEDDRLFNALARNRARFAWAADAEVIEHIDAARLNPRFALRRAFAYGQGPCELAFEERNFATLARHMAVGAAQAAAFGAAAFAAGLVRADARLRLADRAARGLGKVLWFRPQKFYGAAAPQPA